jgi:hypothetical protein
MSRRTINALLAACLALPLASLAAPRGAERAVPARAEFPGKPTGPIVVEHRVTTVPTVGAPVTIEISARAAGAISGLGIEARATAPDAVLVTPPVPVAAQNGVYAWEITVVPLAAEAGYLSVIVTGVIDGAPQARNVTISLRSSAPTEPPTVQGKDGEALIALPAEESSH